MAYRPTPEARRAARALAAATPFGEGEWERAIRRLVRSPGPAVPLTSVVAVVAQTGRPPTDVAEEFARQAAALAAERRAGVERAPSLGELRRATRR